MARLFDDSSNQYLQHSAVLVSDKPISYAAWFNTNDLTASQTAVNQTNVGVGQSFIALNIRPDSAALGNSVTMRYDNSGGTPYIAYATTSISVNTLHHACGTIDSSGNVSAYLDGGNKGTNNFSGPIAGSVSGMDTTSIGATQTATILDYMSGILAEVAIWNTDISDAEVTILALGYSPEQVRPQSLVSYWSLIGRTSPEIAPVGGYGMTLTNGPTTAAHPPVRYPGLSQVFTPSVFTGVSINISKSADYVQIV